MIRFSVAAATVIIVLLTNNSLAQTETQETDSELTSIRDQIAQDVRIEVAQRAGEAASDVYGKQAIGRIAGGVAKVAKVLGSKVGGVGLDLFFNPSSLGDGTPRGFREERIREAGIDRVEIANNGNLDLRSAGGMQLFEANVTRALIVAEALAAKKAGRPYNVANFDLREIAKFEREAEDARNSFPSLTELQMQADIASQTTGLTSHIGDARNPRLADPELNQVLSSAANGPFVTSVETPSTVSTGEFTGEEGLNIAGILNVLAFDSGRLQDGDRVRLTVTDSTGTVFTRRLTLTFGGSRSRVTARRGVVNVKITALNEGSSPPNTGGLRVSGDVSGSRSGNFNLRRGQSGSLAVRVLGN